MNRGHCRQCWPGLCGKGCGADSRRCVFEACEPLRDFRKGLSMTGHLYGKAAGSSWGGFASGWGEVSGNHWGRAKSVSQGDGGSATAPTCGLCRAGEGSSQEQWLCPTAAWEEAASRPAMEPDSTVCGSPAMLPEAGLRARESISA